MPILESHLPRISPAPRVHASPDALDEDDLVPSGDPPGLKAVIEAFKEEERLSRKLKLQTETSRATSAAFRYERLLEDRYADDPSFFIWDQNRALDRQDFDYLFYHRPTSYIRHPDTHRQATDPFCRSYHEVGDAELIDRQGQSQSSAVHVALTPLHICAFALMCGALPRMILWIAYWLLPGAVRLLKGPA